MQALQRISTSLDDRNIAVFRSLSGVEASVAGSFRASCAGRCETANYSFKAEISQPAGCKDLSGLICPTLAVLKW